MPWVTETLREYLEDWYNMSADDVKRKIAKVVIASRTSMDPTFKTYWKNTAKVLATKYNVNLSEIEKCPEYYNETKTSRYH